MLLTSSQPMPPLGWGATPDAVARAENIATYATAAALTKRGLPFEPTHAAAAAAIVVAVLLDKREQHLALVLEEGRERRQQERREAKWQCHQDDEERIETLGSCLRVLIVRERHRREQREEDRRLAELGKQIVAVVLVGVE